MKRLALCSILVLSTLATSARALAVEDGSVFVALGDSYSSGEGVAPFDQGTDISKKNECHRSDNAFARIFPNIEHGLPAPVHVACSGAVTADITNYNKWGEPPQIDALTDQTRLVTLSMGGNDIGFKSVVEYCVVWGNCRAHYTKSGRDKVSDNIKRILRPRLIRMYQRVADKAPNATVAVMGYPHIFRDPKTRGQCRDYITDDELTWLRAKTAELTVAIRESIEAAKRPKVRFVNTLDVFKGKEMCTKSPAVNNISTTYDRAHGAHPNAIGHLFLARLLAATLNLTPDLALSTGGYDFTSVLASEGRIFKNLGVGSGPIGGWAEGRRHVAYYVPGPEDSSQYDVFDVARGSAWNGWRGGYQIGPVGSGFMSIEEQYDPSSMAEYYNPRTRVLTRKAVTKRDLRGGRMVTSTPVGLVVSNAQKPDWMAASKLYLVGPSGKVTGLGTPPGDRLARLGAYDAKLNRIAVVSSWYNDCWNLQTDILSTIPIAGGFPEPVELPPSPTAAGWGVISIDFSPSGGLGVLLWERPEECNGEQGQRRYFNQTQQGWVEDAAMQGAVYASTSSGGWRVKFTGSMGFDYRYLQNQMCTQPDKAWMVGPDGTTYFLGDDPSEALWNTSAGFLSASSSAVNCLWRERST